ncbi:mitochondrial carrier protein domain-containing protein [Trichoderma breve]|uniref:Mitochondrial carrier protein domain-containing protein n=1 Tax=Trichoderma breve TaxID=2034170 RepID=A0A9W9E342_9HYPO|nr:mitochondrial carrier protein domain-containing protein [Trichoderma breve]KAJ4855215.1 mitochondrial carrier protein domain-containing protein [Trichoderma breve]
MAQATLDMTTSVAAQPELAFQRKSRTATMEAVEDIIYGSVAGIAGKYIEYPFDTVKVRLQSQPDHLPLRYTGPVDCFRQSIKADGLRGLYRGISAPLFGRELLYKSSVASRDKEMTLPLLWLTGAISGVFTSFVLTPIELVKCRIQAPALSEGAPVVHLRPTAVIREVYRHEGIRGFWHGQLETVTKAFYKLRVRSATSEAEREAIRSKPLPLWQQAIAGASGGVSYNFLFFPADTIKSRMQTSPVGGVQQRRDFWSEGRAIWRHHGLRGLYRGCGVTCARAAPSSAFIFIVYDGLKRHLPMQ